MPLANAGDGKARIVWIDAAKALAAWMVVTGHLLRQGGLADYLAAVSVSVFFVLAGVTFHVHEDIPAWLRRLAARIVLPYLAVGGISIVLYRILGNYAAAGVGAAPVQTDIRTDLLHLIYASSVGGRMKWNESLWFLPCYLLVMLLAEGIGRIGARHGRLCVLLYLACGAAGWALIERGYAGLPWHLETALLVLPLCGIGQCLAAVRLQQRIRPWISLLFGAGLICYSLQCLPGILTSAGGSLSLRAPRLAGVVDTTLFLLAAVAGVIYLVWFLAGEVPVTQGASRIGAHSLDIVLWNKFPVLALQVLVPQCLPGFAAMFLGGEDLPSLLAAAVFAIPCMALCLLWTWAYGRAAAALRRVP